MQEEVMVSVIMPAFNAEQYIEESIASVLDQTFKKIELIVVNDCSTDSTLEIIKNLSLKDERIIVLDNSNNLGCANSRNKALLEAKGEYIAFCDSDDVWESEKIKKQLDHIKSTNADMVFTAYEMIDSFGTFIKSRSVKQEFTLEDLLKENSVIFSTTLFKKEAIEGICFDASWFHEDYVFLLECLKKNLKFVGIDETLVKYRVHNKGRSFNKFNAAKHRWKIYRDFLDLSVWESYYYFVQYTVNGLRKYR